MSDENLSLRHISAGQSDKVRAELAGEKAYERVVSAARLAVDVEDLRNGSAQVLEQPHAVEDAEATANSPPRKARSASLESLGEDVRRPVKT